MSRRKAREEAQRHQAARETLAASVYQLSGAGFLASRLLLEQLACDQPFGAPAFTAFEEQHQAIEGVCDFLTELLYVPDDRCFRGYCATVDEQHLIRLLAAAAKNGLHSLLQHSEEDGQQLWELPLNSLRSIGIILQNLLWCINEYVVRAPIAQHDERARSGIRLKIACEVAQSGLMPVFAEACSSIAAAVEMQLQQLQQLKQGMLLEVLQEKLQEIKQQKLQQQKEQEGQLGKEQEGQQKQQQAEQQQQQQQQQEGEKSVQEHPQEQQQMQEQQPMQEQQQEEEEKQQQDKQEQQQLEQELQQLSGGSGEKAAADQEADTAAAEPPRTPNDITNALLAGLPLLQLWDALARTFDHNLLSSKIFGPTILPVASLAAALLAARQQAPVPPPDAGIGKSNKQHFGNASTNAARAIRAANSIGHGERPLYDMTGDAIVQLSAAFGLALQEAVQQRGSHPTSTAAVASTGVHLLALVDLSRAMQQLTGYNKKAAAKEAAANALRRRGSGGSPSSTSGSSSSSRSSSNVNSSAGKHAKKQQDSKQQQAKLPDNKQQSDPKQQRQPAASGCWQQLLKALGLDKAEVQVLSSDHDTAAAVHDHACRALDAAYYFIGPNIGAVDGAWTSSSSGSSSAGGATGPSVEQLQVPQQLLPVLQPLLFILLELAVLKLEPPRLSQCLQLMSCIVAVMTQNQQQQRRQQQKEQQEEKGGVQLPQNDAAVATAAAAAAASEADSTTAAATTAADAAASSSDRAEPEAAVTTAPSPPVLTPAVAASLLAPLVRLSSAAAAAAAGTQNKAEPAAAHGAPAAAAAGTNAMDSRSSAMHHLGAMLVTMLAVAEAPTASLAALCFESPGSTSSVLEAGLRAWAVPSGLAVQSGPPDGAVPPAKSTPTAGSPDISLQQIVAWRIAHAYSYAASEAAVAPAALAAAAAAAGAVELQQVNKQVWLLLLSVLKCIGSAVEQQASNSKASEVAVLAMQAAMQFGDLFAAQAVSAEATSSTDSGDIGATATGGSSNGANSSDGSSTNGAGGAHWVWLVSRSLSVVVKALPSEANSSSRSGGGGVRHQVASMGLLECESTADTLSACLMCAKWLAQQLPKLTLPDCCPTADAAPAAAAAGQPPHREQLMEQLVELQVLLKLVRTAATGWPSITSEAKKAAAAAAVPWTIELLQQTSEDICALLPLSSCCNNTSCSNMAKQSEQQLVGGKGCICAGCKTARYCGLACQRAHWPCHKLVCKQLRGRSSSSDAAAATAATAAAPLGSG